MTQGWSFPVISLSGSLPVADGQTGKDCLTPCPGAVDRYFHSVDRVLAEWLVGARARAVRILLVGGSVRTIVGRAWRTYIDRWRVSQSANMLRPNCVECWQCWHYKVLAVGREQ